MPSDAGSVGLVATRSYTFAQPPNVLRLESGATLGPVTLAYEPYGELAPDGGNPILALHALSCDAHAAGWSVDPSAPSAVDGVGAEEKGISTRAGLSRWDDMIGPRQGVRDQPVLRDLLQHPGRPYGSTFPLVTVGDMVNAQRELLRHLGVERLLAVAGGSLGGNQALSGPWPTRRWWSAASRSPPVRA